MSTHFLTFGGGAKNFHDAARRLTKEAHKSNIFSTVHCYFDYDLESMDDFWIAHGNFIKNNKRLYGYCLWKPYLVLKLLETMQDGDRIFYADAGCQFDFDCEDPKKQYDEMVKHMGDQVMTATYCNVDYNMTKWDLVLHLNMQDHPRLKTSQIQATTFMLTKCDRIMTFVRLWYTICCNYHLLDDSPSKAPNHSNYDEHRHEQSIFSLLAKKLDLYDPGPMYKKTKIEKVICLIRNRTGATYPCCRVTGSPYFNFHSGGDHVNIDQLKKLIKALQETPPRFVKECNYDSGRSASAVLNVCENLEEYVMNRGYHCDEMLYRYVISMNPEVKECISPCIEHYDWITVRSPLSESQRKELEKELKPDGVLYVIE